jgi:glycosyltransferase involved in cell wall biosynthesis
VMERLVSILIPAYNAENWIAETIRSAIGQTWGRKEIIIVDDGSKDRTLDVAREFASKEVSVLTQPNQGAAMARNKAYSICQGQYVQWLDADDLLAPDKISRQMDATKARDTKTLLSGPWANFVYRTRKARFMPSPLWENLSPVEWLLRKMEHNAHMQPATWLVSRELTEAAGPWDTRLTLDDDGEYFARVLLASSGTHFVPEAKTYYRVTGPASLSYVGNSERKLASQHLACKLQVSYVLQRADDERARAACVKYLQKYLGFLDNDKSEIATEFKTMAQSLGGQLVPPTLPWKYAWLEKLLGRAAARQAQLRYNRFKWSLIGAWDQVLFKFEGKQQWT